MALFGLFGKKESQDDGGQKKDAFFLDYDDAQTLGDVEFMRKTVEVRRTFPKTKNAQKSAELVSKVSSMEAEVVEKSGQKVIKQSQSATDATPQADQSAGVNLERRKSDSSLDMFRNMAKEIKK